MAVGLCLVALVGANPSAAQELRGRITGVVHDNSGAVLPGVTVTASSPALIQPQTTTTGADGTYRFPALPSGTYTLSYEMSGFQTVKREGIRVPLNTTLTVDAKLAARGLQEALTVTGESPTVDVKTTSIGTASPRSCCRTSRTRATSGRRCPRRPGFQMPGYDVGGSHTGTQTGYMTYGVGDQNKTLLEGINVTEATAANAGYFDFGSFEEFQLGGAGNMGEQAGPGALMNLTVKSGGDRFLGEVYFDYEDENTIGDNVPDAFKAPGGAGGTASWPPPSSTRRPDSGSGLQRRQPDQQAVRLQRGHGRADHQEKLWFFLSYRDNNQYEPSSACPARRRRASSSTTPPS